jgi:choline kinase
VIGIVLAAGASRRLRPHTDDLPKTLLPVDGTTTILDIALRNLATAGIRDVVVVTGHAAGSLRERAPAMMRRHRVTLELVHNDRALDWNNAYSLWLARRYFAVGAMLVNGDTVHPASVEKALVAAGHRGPAAAEGANPGAGPEAGPEAGPGPDPGADASPLAVLAVDDVKALAEEEMKVALGATGRLSRISKKIDPATADAEYIGVALIEPAAARPLAEALEATWRRDPGLYYEDGFQELAERGGFIAAQPIGAVDWVEVDDPDDLRRAREIAARC